MTSIGDSTHSTATSSASFARRGTSGDLRSRRAAVTQAGRNAATSRSRPGGSRRANTTISTQLDR